jgi:hypothetical protein
MEDTTYSATVNTPVEDISDVKTVSADQFDAGASVSVKASCTEDITVDDSKATRETATITVK